MKFFTVALGFMASVALASPPADVSVLVEREAEAQGIICINCIDTGSCKKKSRPKGCVKDGHNTSDCDKQCNSNGYICRCCDKDGKNCEES